jgi:hypothetical protein
MQILVRPLFPGVLSMGFVGSMGFVELPGAIRTIEIMPFAGAENKCNKDGEQGKAFHRPLLAIMPGKATPDRISWNLSLPRN